MSDDQTHCSAEPLQRGLEMLFCGSRPAEAFASLRAAAESGDIQGQYLTGMLCYLGQGTEKDLAQAVRWLTRAAEQGHADAQYELAQRYAWGEGAALDPEQAAHWNRKAAAQKHPAALVDLRGDVSSN